MQEWEQGKNVGSGLLKKADALNALSHVTVYLKHCVQYVRQSLLLPLARITAVLRKLLSTLTAAPNVRVAEKDDLNSYLSTTLMVEGLNTGNNYDVEMGILGVVDSDFTNGLKTTNILRDIEFFAAIVIALLANTAIAHMSVSG